MEQQTVNQIGMYFGGAAGNQFGKNVYITMIPYKSIDKFLTVFEEVQRKIDNARVKDIAQYILNGLNENNLCFLSAITATCRGNIFYDEIAQKVVIDINSTLSINDGQHRVSGIKLALKKLKKDIESTQDLDELEILNRKLERLEDMTIPVVIFSGIQELHEQQLFHDLNLLAKRPNKSISLKFDHTNPYNFMAKELAVENGYLQEYGVDTEKTQLRETNPNLMLLSTLRNTISYIICGSNNDKKKTLTSENYDSWKETVNEIFNVVFANLPTDCTDRTKYIIGLAVTIQGIGKYANFLLNKDEVIDWKKELGKLSEINWRHSNSMWKSYGGSYDESKKRFVFNGTGSGINGIAQALKENLNPKLID
ncbi:DNA sulfur modification protein DndB [Bacillus paralicheniformis]|uniref:DNA sulfur modification protein DndB n=1 Tax=Bacillus paralicheniformis TaxID=1648923 RepID=UPI00128D77B4|nr:DNA sulfur modification protein DndB [Bacillus paralicheniformis]MPQ24513.1 DGQHR domain-containing protein [Bacillus paralicheniformis]